MHRYLLTKTTQKQLVYLCGHLIPQPLFSKLFQLLHKVKQQNNLSYGSAESQMMPVKVFNHPGHSESQPIVNPFYASSISNSRSQDLWYVLEK